MRYPVSPNDETLGLVYFARLCDKIRLQKSGELMEDYQSNLGLGMDLWTCQLLEIDYAAIVTLVESGASDAEVLEKCFEQGKAPSELEVAWWNSYMRNRGFRDDLSEKLQMRIQESGFEDREIHSFFDYINADEER